MAVGCFDLFGRGVPPGNNQHLLLPVPRYAALAAGSATRDINGGGGGRGGRGGEAFLSAEEWRSAALSEPRSDARLEARSEALWEFLSEARSEPRSDARAESLVEPALLEA